MSTYAIGDVQGCFDSLCSLLKVIDFKPSQDTLWFTGDLANRGPKPLETLRFIKELSPSAVCVLGNHDLALLAALEGIIELPADETARAILTAPDAKALANWLRHLPLMVASPSLGIVMTHAGIYPYWDIQHAKAYAHEVENILKSENYIDLLHTMYGNTPTVWDDSLTGPDRMRFILNAFTRMRFLTAKGELNFDVKGPPHNFPTLTPWFAVENRQPIHEPILFGHWASLQGKCNYPGIYALDEGCVWGECLAALCLETKERFKVSC